MAVAVDATANSGAQTGATYQYNHTCTGTNRLLVVGVVTDTLAVTGVTYVKGGVDTAMTLLDSQGPANAIVTVFYMINPDSGTNPVKVTLPSADQSNAGSVSFTGVHQTTAVGAAFKASGDNNTNPSVTVTDGATDDWTMDVVGVSKTSTETYAPDGSQAQQWNINNGTGIILGIGSTEAGGASVVMSGVLTPNSTTWWRQIAVAIKVAGGATSAQILPAISGEQRHNPRLRSWIAVPTGHTGNVRN